MSFPASPRIFYISILVFCCSTACSQDSHPATDIHTSNLPLIKLDHHFIISDSEDLYLQQFSGVNSDSRGRIYLPDQRALQINVFDSTGSYLTSIGREGSGPGEFQSLLNTYIDENDQFFVFDISQARNTVFIQKNESWEAEYQLMIDGNRYGIETADSDGNLILRQSIPQIPQPGAFWYEHELATAHLDSGLIKQNVLIIKEMGSLVTVDRRLRQIPYGRTSIIASDIEGNLYVVWNEQFDLVVYNAQMELLDSLTVPIPNQPISREERTEAMEEMGDNFRFLGREHMPDTKPVISNLFVDGNKNLWLQTFDSPEYLVLDKNGDPFGSFDLDEELQLVHVDENRIYALKTGDEGYEIHVFGYQI